MTRVILLSGSDTHFENSMEKKLLEELEESFPVEKVDFDDADDVDVPENLEKIQEKIESTKEAYMIGYCLGGTLALLLRTNDKVSGVVAMDPPRGIVDREGRRFGIKDIDAEESVLLIGSEQAEEGLPKTNTRREILKTSHSFRGKAEKVSELVEDWLEERIEVSEAEVGIDG